LLDVLARLAAERKQLGEYEKSEAALVRELALRERSARAAEPAYAENLYRLGVVQWVSGHPALAETTLKRCEESAERSAGRDSLEFASCQHWLGVVYNETGRYVEAQTVLREAVEIRERLLGPARYSARSATTSTRKRYTSVRFRFANRHSAAAASSWRIL
jgi:tetratricopeptide (TPR) repeat protein